jgi:hypothetical protein
MKTSLIVQVLAALYVTANAWAQTGEAPATEPMTVAPPGIVVVPFLFPPRGPAPGQQTPAGTQEPQSCPATDQKLELIG